MLHPTEPDIPTDPKDGEHPMKTMILVAAAVLSLGVGAAYAAGGPVGLWGLMPRSVGRYSWKKRMMFPKIANAARMPKTAAMDQTGSLGRRAAMLSASAR